MPKLYVLVGVPGSGKSTWIAKQPFDWNRTVIASTDNYVEKVAKQQGKTYNEVFKDAMPAAISHMMHAVRDAVKNDYDIVWDQTNTSVVARKKKLVAVPDTYQKIAVVFSTPDKKEHERRLSSRPGKVIPDTVIQQMQSTMTIPTEAEGFDEVVFV